MTRLERVTLWLPREIVQAVRVIVHDAFPQDGGSVEVAGDEAKAFAVAIGELIQERATAAETWAPPAASADGRSAPGETRGATREG